jgi:polar amino acid transport system substrate-binding protein
MRTRAALAAFVAVAGLLAACSATGVPVDPAPVNAADRPRPPGAQDNPPPPSGGAAADDSCNPKSSFRPGPLPPAGQMPAGSFMQQIAGRKLIAGVDQATYLMGFRNAKTNALEGFDIDRVREVALAIYGGTLADIDSHIEYRVVTSAHRIDALKNDEVDIVVRTMTANCARWKDIYFSDIYYTAGQRVLVEKSSTYKSLDDLGGKKVCAQTGSTSIGKLATYQSKPIPVATTSWSDCLVLLQQHQVEAVSTDDTILAGLEAQDPNTVMVGPTITSEPYGIGVSQKHEDLVRFINGVLERSFKNGDWQQSYNTWIGRSGQPAQAPNPTEYRG